MEIFLGIITHQPIRRGTSHNLKGREIAIVPISRVWTSWVNSSPSDVVTLRPKMTPLREPHVMGR